MVEVTAVGVNLSFESFVGFLGFVMGLGNLRPEIKGRLFLKKCEG